MMMESEAMIWGYPLEVVLMLASGIFYIICGIVVWRAYRREKTELIGALFAFLVYQAAAMVLMGVAIETMNMTYDALAGLSILLGSVFMLKFPFSLLSQNLRKTFFYISLIVVLGIFGWFMLTPEREMAFMHFTIWYDIIVNGVVVGCFAVLFGIRTRERALKIKAVGGGAGIATCCIVANVAMISGAVVMSSIFQFLAPLLIITAIFTGRRAQVRSNTPSDGSNS